MIESDIYINLSLTQFNKYYW